MGVPGLWQKLSPAAEIRTLAQVTVTEGFEQRRREDGCLIIGFDASIWLYQAQIAIKLARGTGARMGENPAVRILFNRLCRLLTLPITPLFIFDGPGRPPKKRGKKVGRQPHALCSPFQKLIEAFGYSWYIAPGEAEAELAMLNLSGNVDAVISEDSDAMVFGACCVFRMKNAKDFGDQITVFNSQAVEDHPNTALDRAGLFLIALLHGGDYDKTGLRGCGLQTAHQIAKSPLAHGLFNAAMYSSRSALSSYLDEWREDLRRLLATDYCHVLNHPLPSLASHVPDSFPSLDVVLQYAQPLTSWTGNSPDLDRSGWHFRQPHVAKIGILCEKLFSWASLGEMEPRFRNTLWPGVAIRYLLSQPTANDARRMMNYANDTVEETCSISCLYILRIIQASLGPTKNTVHDVSGYTVEMMTDNLLKESIAGLEADVQTELLSGPRLTKATIWVPASILEASLPAVVNRFQGRRPTAPSYPCILGPTYTADADNSSSSSICTNVEFTDGPSHHPLPYPVSHIDAAVPPEGSHICTQGGQANSLEEDSDIEWVEGPSTKPGNTPRFLGYLDLCSPSPSP